MMYQSTDLITLLVVQFDVVLDFADDGLALRVVNEAKSPGVKNILNEIFYYQRTFSRRQLLKTLC